MESSLSGLFSRAFNDPEFSDCEVHVENKVFHVSKIVLKMRSDVFQACFRHNSVEQQTNIIKIEEASAEIVELMLRYMYTDVVEDLDSNAYELFKMADRYNVVELRKLCAKNMCQHLQIDSILDCLRVAYLVNDADLKAQCIRFVVDNADQILDRTEWAELTGHEPQIYPDLTKLLLGRLIKGTSPSQEQEAEHDDLQMETVRLSRARLDQHVLQYDVANPPGNDPRASDDPMIRRLLGKQNEIEDQMRIAQVRANFINDTLRHYSTMNQKLIQQLADGSAQNVDNLSPILETSQRIRHIVRRAHDRMDVIVSTLNGVIPTNMDTRDRRRRNPFEELEPRVRRERPACRTPPRDVFGLPPRRLLEAPNLNPVEPNADEFLGFADLFNDNFGKIRNHQP